MLCVHALMLAELSVQVDDIPPEQHALVPSYGGGAGGGRRIHPLPFSDPALPGLFPTSFTLT